RLHYPARVPLRPAVPLVGLALPRRRARAGPAPAGGRARPRRTTRPRRARRRDLPLDGRGPEGRQVERARDSRRRRAVRAPGRPRAVDTSGGGARAALLPRARPAVGDRDGAGARSAGDGLARCARAPEGDLDAARPRPAARERASRAAPDRLLARVPRLPRVEG